MKLTNPQPQTEPLPTAARCDRVRQNTAPEVNSSIDQETVDSLRLHNGADRELIAHRLEKLDREWDMERILEMNASSLIVVGVLLAATTTLWWLLLPLTVASFLLLHAIQGWCPPVPLLRRRGIRTRKEIERERCGLKLLRGDFDAFHSQEGLDPNAVLRILDQ